MRVKLEVTTKKVNQKHVAAPGLRLDAYSKHVEANQN